MKTQRIPMTIDEFHAMPQKLGWKHEYWSGQAHISPRHTAVVLAKLAVEPHPVNSPCTVRPVTAADLPRLIPAYIAAFQDTIDYCDWSQRAIRDAAKKNLHDFFAGTRGQPLPASQVAVAGRQVVGAALLVEKKAHHLLLDLLFVRPQWQRKGVATAVMAAALNTLHAAGAKTLFSRFMLGNEESRSWHHRFGFVDEPDLFLARSYYYYFDDKVKRHQTLDDLVPAELDALVAKRDRWRQELTRLNTLAEEKGFTAVMPRLL